MTIEQRNEAREELRLWLVKWTNCEIQTGKSGAYPCGTCAIDLFKSIGLTSDDPAYNEHNDEIDRLNEVWRAILQIRDTKIKIKEDKIMMKDEYSETPIEKMKILNVSDDDFFWKARKEKENNLGNLCGGWDFLAENTTENIQNLWLKDKINDLQYLAKITEVGMKTLKINEEHKDLFHTLAYIMSRKLTLAEHLKREKDYINKGYKKVNWENKELIGKNVVYVVINDFDGIWQKEQDEKRNGKVIWSEGDKAMFIMQKRHTRTGYRLSNEILIKEVSNVKP